MAVTNDVALITFVPFAILTLQGLSLSSLLIPTIVLQTIAANLGSMATPVGNPQNLFLYSFYGLSAQDFFGTVLPVTAISLALLMGAVFCFPSKPLKAVSSHDAPKPGLLKLCLFLSLFALCLLTVFHLLPAGILLLFTIAALLLWERSLFSQVDYSLLFTFVCFFIFAGNIGRIPLISETLRSLMETSPLLSSVLASQLISNVPAAVLLSGCTLNSRALLLGVNIGGLGTPIASLASLISMKYYWNLPGAQKGKYLLTFLLANLFALLLLLIFTFLFRETH